MKVLLVSNMFPDEEHPSYGTFVKCFADELDKIGIKHIDSVMYQYENVIGKLFGYIKFYVWTFLMALFGRYDCVYVHQASHSSPPVILAHKLRKFKTFTNVHGCDVAPENPRQEKMQKYTRAILELSDRVIVPSEYYREYVKNKYRISEGKIYIYPSAGVNKDVFYEKPKEQKEEARRKYHFDKDVSVFGMAGRISVGKGWDTFVKSVSILKREKIKASFAIVGVGVESDNLDKLIIDCGLTEDIIRTSLLPQSELCDFYNAIDYFVFPTKRESESLGLVAIEAMACGTPVIASNYAAPKYYIKNGINGYKFPVGDSEQLADIIMKCCISVDTQEYKRLHDGAIETAAMYSNEAIRTQLKDIMKM